MNRFQRIITLGIPSSITRSMRQDDRAFCGTRKRLERGVAYLENLERQRARGEDSLFGSLMEQRIIWRELMELEVKAANHEIDGITTAARESEGHPHS